MSNQSKIEKARPVAETAQNPLDKLRTAYEMHKDFFEGAFHSALWEILANNVFAGKVATFCNNYREEGNQLGVAVANEAGYTPTPAYFKPGIPQNKVDEILAQLNAQVFGLDEKAALHVLVSSMAKGRVNKKD
jgi:hypothetical protein